MTTKRENILAAIRTKLTDTAGVDTRIFRTRVDPIARAESPAIIIQPIRDVCVQTTSLPKLDWTMTVRITVIEGRTSLIKLQMTRASHCTARSWLT